MESFNPKKALGADGLTTDICKQVVVNDVEMQVVILNKCWRLSYFPTEWKIATVVMLRKPGKEDYTHPKSYRPIGLLPIMGKILEKILVKRLAWHLVPRISPHQYGFMLQRGAEDALHNLMGYIRERLHEKKLILMVSLDIEGAFDSAWWPAIKVRLVEERCPKLLTRILYNYLSDRRIKLRYAGNEITKNTNKGYVQGSIEGPILWNLLLDPLLRSLTARGDYCQSGFRG